MERIPMLNMQRPEHLSESADLDIINIWPTIQGEGPFVGQSAVFIRLAGCNLQCPNCDTDYTTGRKLMRMDEVVDEVIKISNVMHNDFVVITGGEPLRQPIGPLCHALVDAEFDVQIETNGVLFMSGLPFDSEHFTIVCSPKTPFVHNSLKKHISFLKYIVEADNISDADGLPINVLGMNSFVARPWADFEGVIYIQPADSGDEQRNKLNAQAAVQSCMKFGHTLSIQIHKIIGVP